MKTPTDILLGLLESAVTERCDTQDKVSVQLSGGLDSAIIQAIVDCNRLYCVTFPEDGVDNLTEAALASPGKEVIPVTFTRDEMLEVLPEVAELTQGVGTWSQVCQWFVNRKIAEDGATMVLIGEGADELFYGYARYRVCYWLERMREDPHLEAYSGILEHMFGQHGDILIRMLSRTTELSQATSAVFRNLEAHTGNLVTDIAAIEEKEELPTLLKFGQIMAETHGLRCEFPFMDERVVRYAHQLPYQCKIDTYMNKSILRNVGKRLGIHPSIVYERTKKGLFIPPSWRPENEPLWSRKWFERLMTEAYESGNNKPVPDSSKPSRVSGR